MRTLIVAEDAARADSLAERVRRARHEVSGVTDSLRVTRTLHRDAGRPPGALLLDVGGNVERLRSVLERARGALGTSIPALLLLPQDSNWLAGAVPADVQPAVPVPERDLSPATIAAALRLLDGDDAGRSGLRFDAQLGEVEGPMGTVHLTPSERAILTMLLRDSRAVVRHAQLAQALWGAPLVDRHSRAAIRSHIYTLRRKLRATGYPGMIASLPGAGYRMVEREDVH